MPGDEIMGYLIGRQGHRRASRRIARTSPNTARRPSAASRSTGTATSAATTARALRIDVDNKPGVLAQVAAAIAEGDSNIDTVEYQRARPADLGDACSRIEVRNRKHLADVMRRVRRAGRRARGLAVSVRRRLRQRCCATHLSRSMYVDATPDDSMPRHVIHTDRAPTAIGPYSQAVRSGNTVYFSGQIPLDPATGAAGRRRHHARRRGACSTTSRRSARPPAASFDAGRARRHLPDRPGQLRRGQCGDGGIFQRAVSGALDDRVSPRLPRGAQVEVDAILVVRLSAVPRSRGRASGMTTPALIVSAGERAAVVEPARRRPGARGQHSPRAAC